MNPSNLPPSTFPAQHRTNRIAIPLNVECSPGLREPPRS